VGRDPATVLVVDDDASIRLLCRVNLELDGYRVLEAATLAQARAALGSTRVDCVLLDVHVGGDDGYELLEELRGCEEGVPVALFTGSASVEEQHARDATAILPKPFTLEQLARTVAHLIDCDADVDSHIGR
jgi:DNA-binding NtrC family response regulator